MSGIRLTHVPGLDGLRGVAVVAVLLFHGGMLRGGFLGVDLFFVLSGFLITSLLMAEWNKTGRIDLLAFWRRRARRLLPALFALIAAIALMAVVLARPDELGSWRWDSLATILYSANWRQALANQDYWAQFATPSPLRHTWSLAIEEQFYLFWPIVVLGVLSVRAGSKRSLLVVALGGALASATAMWVMWNPDDPNRVYLGTDTRAAGMLLGAATAVWFRRRGPASSDGERRAIEVIAVAAAVMLGVSWTLLEGTSPFLYRYGFFALELCAVAVIVSVIQPVRGPVAAVLSAAPLRWLGLISYGLYLWHWPVFLVLDANQQRLGLGGSSLLGAKLATSVLIATFSFYALERPVRLKGLGAFGRPAILPAAACLIILGLLWATLGAVDTQPVSAGETASVGTPSGAEGRGALPELTGAEKAAPPPVIPPIAAGAVPRPAGRNARVLVVGDSVAGVLGATMERQLANELKVTVAPRAMPACPLDDGAGRIRDTGGVNQVRADCMRWPKFWSEDVRAFRPDVVLMAFHGPVPEASDVGGQWRSPCSPEFHDHYLALVKQAVDILSSAGAVVFVAPSAYARFPFLDLQDQDGRVDCMTGVYEEAIAAKPAARRLMLDRYVCPDHQCRDTIDGVTIRPDGIHYDRGGAPLIARWILTQMLQPTQ